MRSVFHIYFFIVVKPTSSSYSFLLLGNPSRKVCSDGATADAHGNNENTAPATNNACATTPAGEGASSADNIKSHSPLSDITAVVIDARSPVTHRLDNHIAEAHANATDGSEKYTLRSRRSLRPATKSDFEYSEELLEVLDVCEERTRTDNVHVEVPEYERLRRDRIAANLQKLHALGLHNGMVETGQTKKALKRKDPALVSDACPLRRSLRARTISCTAGLFYAAVGTF